MSNHGSSPSLTNCSFSGNGADYDYGEGGGMSNHGSSPSLTNCSFSGNTAELGGGMYNETSSPSITNCSFSGNGADYGGGILNIDNSPSITNCILWGNSATTAGSEIEIWSSDVPIVTYSIVRGGYTGTGNVDKDPLFVGASDLHLQACSPAIDAGSNTAVPGGVTTDLDGNSRIAHTTVDMGAYEYTGSLYTLYKDGDGDTYGAAMALPETFFCPTQPGYSSNNTDCNDADVSIHVCATCGDVTGFTTGLSYNSTAKKYSATFKWVAPVDAVQWQVQYKSTNMGSKWVDVTVPKASDRSVATGFVLALNQSYQWHIRAKCSKVWMAYSNAVSFKTTSASLSRATVADDNTEGIIEVLKLHPNPTYGKFILELHIAERSTSKAQIQLVDMLGRTVYSENTKVNNGFLQKPITVSSALAHGTYLVKVVVNDKIYKAQVVYQK
jgi:hypothetical protein